jgi:hypothetical protein
MSFSIVLLMLVNLLLQLMNYIPNLGFEFYLSNKQFSFVEVLGKSLKWKSHQFSK